MECQVEKLEHFRYILLFECNRGAKATEAARNICAVYGDNAIGERTARKWFSRFKKDRFDIRDTSRSGIPSGFNEDRLNTLIHNDPRQRTLELANVMNCDHSIIIRHLHSMIKVQKSGVWVPHALNQWWPTRGTRMLFKWHTQSHYINADSQEIFWEYLPPSLFPALPDMALRYRC